MSRNSFALYFEFDLTLVFLFFLFYYRPHNNKVLSHTDIKVSTLFHWIIWESFCENDIREIELHEFFDSWVLIWLVCKPFLGKKIFVILILSEFWGHWCWKYKDPVRWCSKLHWVMLDNHTPYAFFHWKISFTLK